MTSDMQKGSCAEWAEKLAALHPSDLTAAEQGELSTHLASCSACAQISGDYHHLARLVRDLATTEAPPDHLPALPDLLDAPEATGIWSVPVSQPGVTSSRPTPIAERRPRRASRIALAVLAAVLIASVLLGSFVVGRQYIASPIVSQGQGPVYYITPQGGLPPASTPHMSLGGPMVLAGPTPPFFIDGNVYRNTSVYRADTGEPIQQYLKDLGAVHIYNPRLVDGILYIAVRTADYHREIMYALRASDGVVLWKWNDCGESVNMSSAAISNGIVYFVCQAAPSLYRLYALRARTGVLLWHDILAGEVDLDVLVEHHTLYIQVDNQLLAKNADTGTVLWKRSFGERGNSIYQAGIGNGLIYIVQQTALFALQASNGARVWEYHFVGNYSALQPFVDQGVVYLFVGQQNEPATMYALDSVTGALRWQKQLSIGNYGSFVVDHGNLYMVVNVLTQPQQLYPSTFKRALLAIRGSDGHTLWQQDIPWNKGKLRYAMIGLPRLSAGDGRLYLVDWQSGQMQDLKATMGAFSESNGALLWTRDAPQPW